MAPVILVEVLDRHHRVRARHQIDGTNGVVHCTVGRGAGCDVVLDDPFVAATHARVSVDAEGRVTVTDLGSVNGVEVDGRRLHGAEPVSLADGLFGVGRTRLRVRTATEVIAPEQVDGAGLTWLPRATEQKLLAAAFAASVAMTVFEVWTATVKPRELSTSIVTTLLTLFALAGLWIVLWALASRVAFGESRWLRHALIVAVAYATFSVVAKALDVANGALGLHVSSTIVGPVLTGVGVSMVLSSHLVNASPMRARTAVTLGVVIPAVALAAILWIQVRAQERNPAYIDDRDQVLPPALLWRRGLPLERFATELAQLRARADAKRTFIEREDPTPDEDETY
jgi:FHA domain